MMKHASLRRRQVSKNNVSQPRLGPSNRWHHSIPRWATPILFAVALSHCGAQLPQTTLPTTKPTTGSPSAAGPSSQSPTSGADASAENHTPVSGQNTEEQDFLRLINSYRSKNNLPSLTLSPGLQKAARWKSENMAKTGFFSHDDPDGRSFQSRLKSFYLGNTIGENIAAGNESASATFEQWRNSKGHNANMLGNNFFVIGIARAASDDAFGWYWTTDFGGSLEP